MQNNITVTKAQNKILFPLGQVFITPGAREALAESNQFPIEFLSRHSSGDWGIIRKEDWKGNDFSVKEGFRILSAYKKQGRELRCE